MVFVADDLGLLAVLDDADLTGTEQRLAEVAAVPDTMLAERLTAYLVREIMLSRAC